MLLALAVFVAENAGGRVSDLVDRASECVGETVDSAAEWQSATEWQSAADAQAGTSACTRATTQAQAQQAIGGHNWTSERENECDSHGPTTATTIMSRLSTCIDILDGCFFLVESYCFVSFALYAARRRAILYASHVWASL